MIGYCEPVRFVPYALNKMQRAVAAGKDYALLPVRNDYFFVAFGKAYCRNVIKPEAA